MKQYSPYSTPSSDPVTNIWHDALNNYAGSVTMNAMRGGVMKPYEVVGDAFGNALGNSIVEGMQKPDQSDAETARLANAGNPYAYYPDETNAEKARLGRYEEAAMDAEYLQQSDFIQNRRLEEFTLARGDAALTAMRDADIDAQALARSNAAARRNNPNYGHEGRGSVAPPAFAGRSTITDPAAYVNSNGGGGAEDLNDLILRANKMPWQAGLTRDDVLAARRDLASVLQKTSDPRTRLNVLGAVMSINDAAANKQLLTPDEIIGGPDSMDLAVAAGAFGGSNGAVPSGIKGTGYAGPSNRSAFRAIDSTLRPRVDVTDEFTVTRLKGGGVDLDYRDPDLGHGLGISVDRNGTLGFDIRANPSSAATLGSGRDMFISGMRRLDREGVAVNQIRGYWMDGTGSVNADQYRANIAAGMTPQVAAANTWTGKIAADFGFNSVKSVQQGSHTTIVIFGK